MIKLFKTREDIDLDSSGDLILNDIVMNARVKEVLNSQFIADVEILKDVAGKWEDVKEDHIITLNTPAGPQPFTIVNIIDNLHSISLFCRHSFFDLEKCIIYDTFIKNKNGQAAITQIENNIEDKPLPFRFYSDISKLDNLRLVRMYGVSSLIGDDNNTFKNRFGGELEVNRFNAYMNKTRGMDRGYEIRWAKNITGFKCTSNIDDLVTRAVPIGFDGIMMSSSIKYIESPLANQYDRKFYKVIKFDDVKLKSDIENNEEEGFNTQAEVDEELTRRVNKLYENGLDRITATIDVNFVHLKDTIEYKNNELSVLETLHLGDTVTVILEPYNINYKARMVEYEYDALNDTYVSCILGDAEGNYFSNSGAVDGSGSAGNDTTGNELVGYPPKFDILWQNMINHMTDMINTGVVDSYTYYRPNEFIVGDSKALEECRNVIRINKNGLAMSQSGYNGTYKTGITIDGKFVITEQTALKINAALLESGTVKAEHLSVNAKNELRDGLVTETNLTAELGKIELEVSEKVNDLETSTNEKISKIEQTSNSITQSVERVESDVRENSNKISIAEEKLTADGIFNTVKNKFSGLSGSNLIKNSKGRLGHKNWNVYRHGGSGVVINESYNTIDNSRYALQFAIKNNIGTRGGLLSHSIPVRENTKYTLTAEMTTHRGDVIIFEGMCWDKIVDVANINPNIEKIHIGVMRDSQITSLTFTTPPGTKFMNIYLWGEYISSSTTWNFAHYWIKDLRLNEGEIPHPWCESNTFSESSISQLADEVEIKVNKDDVISSINLSADGATINANKINLQGYVTIGHLSSDEKTIINNAEVSSGKIYGSTMIALNGKNGQGILTVNSGDVYVEFFRCTDAWRLGNNGFRTPFIYSSYGVRGNEYASDMINKINFYGVTDNNQWLQLDNTFTNRTEWIRLDPDYYSNFKNNIYKNRTIDVIQKFKEIKFLDNSTIYKDNKTSNFENILDLETVDPSWLDQIGDTEKKKLNLDKVVTDLIKIVQKQQIEIESLKNLNSSKNQRRHLASSTYFKIKKFITERVIKCS